VPAFLFLQLELSKAFEAIFVYIITINCMKKMKMLCLSAILLCNMFTTFGQTLPKAVVANINKGQHSVEILVEADVPFYVGSNVFVLNIGTFSFDIYRQIDIDQNGKLFFIIPKTEFAQLKENSPIYLTYGHLFDPEVSNDEKEMFVRDSPDQCQFLGLFSSKMKNK
jgi:hypothetical protein